MGFETVTSEATGKGLLYVFGGASPAAPSGLGDLLRCGQARGPRAEAAGGIGPRREAAGPAAFPGRQPELAARPSAEPGPARAGPACL